MDPWLQNGALSLVQILWAGETNMAPFMPFRVILVIEWQHNTWTNMIVKMTILSLLGSSDDKEKIGITRPEGLHLRWFRFGPRDKNWKDCEEMQVEKIKTKTICYHRLNRWWVNCTHRCNKPGTELTDVGCFTLTGVMDLEAEETAWVLQAPVKPTIKAKWASVQLSRDSIFSGGFWACTHRLNQS